MAAQAYKQSSSDVAARMDSLSVEVYPSALLKAAPLYLAYLDPGLPTQVAASGQFDPVVIFWPG